MVFKSDVLYCVDCNKQCGMWNTVSVALQYDQICIKHISWMFSTLNWVIKQEQAFTAGVGALQHQLGLIYYY